MCMGILTICLQSIKVHSCDKLFQSLIHFSYRLHLVSATQHIQLFVAFRKKICFLIVRTHKTKSIILLFVQVKRKHKRMARAYRNSISDVQKCKQTPFFGCWCQSYSQGQCWYPSFNVPYIDLVYVPHHLLITLPINGTRVDITFNF